MIITSPPFPPTKPTFTQPTRQISFTPPLWMQRRGLASRIIHSFDVSDVLDLGCGEAALLEILINSSQLTRLYGVDIDSQCIHDASLNCMPTEYHKSYPREREIEINLYHGSLGDIDERFIGVDCIASLEVYFNY